MTAERRLAEGRQVGTEGWSLQSNKGMLGGAAEEAKWSPSTHSVFKRGKNIVLSLIERGGEARSFHVESTKKEDIIPIVRANIAKETHVMTDESNTYSGLDKIFDKHGVVDHSRKEYSYTDRLSGVKIGINSAEGYDSVFNRGMKGVYQHCAEKHLHRYVAEFDFRHSNRSALGIEDAERADKLAAGIVGKRLTYLRTGETA